MKIAAATLFAVAVFLGIRAEAVTTFPLPATQFKSSAPVEITEGADGAMWFTEARGAIGRIDLAGTVTEWLLNGASDPRGITRGPDGNVWFTEVHGNVIGRITPDGQITRFGLPSPNASPTSIVTGPDDALWFTEFSAGRIGRIDISGSIREFALRDPYCGPFDIAAGPDASLSFTETNANRLGRITLSGAITEIAIPTVDSQPGGITVDRFGATWFTEQQTDKVGRLSPAGVIVEYPVRFLGNPLEIITVGDSVYFTLFYGYAIGRLTKDGNYSEIPLFKNSHPLGLTQRSDGSLWFTEYSEDLIGVIAPPPSLHRRRTVMR